VTDGHNIILDDINLIIVDVLAIDLLHKSFKYISYPEE